MKTKMEKKRAARKPSRPRLTVQLSSHLLEAIEERADEEAIPVAVFVRRAVTRLVNEHERTGKVPRREVSAFAEDRRAGRRGPMRQWPNAVSYVADVHIADGLRRLAAEEDVEVSTLAREAIASDLGNPGPVRPGATRDRFGFTTSGAPQQGHAIQHLMDEAWRSTNE